MPKYQLSQQEQQEEQDLLMQEPFDRRVRNHLGPITNIIAMIETGHHDRISDDMIQQANISIAKIIFLSEKAPET